MSFTYISRISSLEYLCSSRIASAASWNFLANVCAGSSMMTFFTTCCVIVEVAVGRGADPLGAVAEVDVVHVHLEDLVLGVPVLQPDRERRPLEPPRAPLRRG